MRKHCSAVCDFHIAALGVSSLDLRPFNHFKWLFFYPVLIGSDGLAITEKQLQSGKRRRCCRMNSSFEQRAAIYELVLEQRASIWTRISWSSTLEWINFSAFNRFRLRWVDLKTRSF